MAKNAPGMFQREGIGLIELFQLFPDNKTAEAWVVHTRWPDGLACPHCGSTNVNDKATHPTMPFRCRDCIKYFSPKTGTVMARSNLNYHIWVIAIYLYATNLKGVSSMKLHRDLPDFPSLGWFIGRSIRHPRIAMLPS